MENIPMQKNGFLKLKTSLEIPEVWDMIIVGGGPAGTAAAFRAKELGIKALVIDFDDILRRIRDYAKEKPILPDYGGGDRRGFPKGGKIFSQLHFSPIDKDEMHQLWKRYYYEFSIPAQIGIELIGLVQRKDDIWEVQVKNHQSLQTQGYLAKHVVLGIGRGSPRRFDIPGNSEGIAHRLADARNYLGAPVCIIGGGTSAAEAAIAISNAKISSGDPSAVYWSYRGAKMPRVSAALSEVFFEAYIKNGNIRYYPESEPVAVLTAADRREYLSLRVDRREISDRPVESLNLEFPKDKVIACIGEDLPRDFLGNLGIHMMTGGPKQKKRMVVTPYLETCLSNVYLVGDTLSQAYLVTHNFQDDPALFREVKHPGNIKSALLDGLLVSEVVAQKLAGKVKIKLNIAFTERPQRDGKLPISEPLPSKVGVSNPSKKDDVPQHTSRKTACLIRCLGENIEGESYLLPADKLVTLGRKDCDISFPEDTALAGHHATVIVKGQALVVQDAGSESGIYLRAEGGKSQHLTAGSVLRLGGQFLRFSRENGHFQMAHFNRAGKLLREYPLTEKTIVVGREAPDVSLDTSDMMLSRRHLSILVEDGQLHIRDLNSLNGTYLKIAKSSVLQAGDRFRIGKQLLAFNIPENREIDSKDAVSEVSSTKNGAVGKELPTAEKDLAALTIIFKNSGKTIPFRKGESICEIAERSGIAIKAECRAGSCGSDPIRIIAGAENLQSPNDEETATIEDICELEAGKCRMACMARPSGPVTVEIIA